MSYKIRGKKWIHGLAAALDKGVAGVGFPDLISINIDKKDVYVLISMSESWIIIYDTFKERHLIYDLDEYTNSNGDLAKMVCRKLRTDDVHRVEIKNTFNKWFNLYENIGAKWIRLRVK